MRVLHVSRSLLLGLACAAATAGCVTDAGNVLVIVQNQVPEEGCVISGSLSDLYRPEGFIDTNASGGYFFTPVIESRATVSAGQDPALRRVTIEGAEVKLEVFDQNGMVGSFSQAPNSFTSRTSGSVDPGGTLGLGFEVLKLQHLTELAGLVGDDRWQVLAEVVVFGQLSGGEVESQPFVYPITVCNGCLQVNLGDCAALPQGFRSEETGGICNDLQDATLECCDDGGALVCPAVSTMTN